MSIKEKEVDDVALQTVIHSESFEIENSSLSQGTIGLTGKDMYRAHPSLLDLKEELE